MGWRPGSWQERTFRAQAVRDAARIVDYNNALEFAAQARELERALEVTTESISWRITAPFRAARRTLAALQQAPSPSSR